VVYGLHYKQPVINPLLVIINMRSHPDKSVSITGDDDDSTTMQIVSKQEIFSSLRIVLERDYGYMLVATATGQYCGYTAYVREHDLKIKGLNTPADFWYWRPLNSTYEDVSFKLAIKASAEDLIAHCPSEQIQVYKALALNILDNSAGQNSTVFSLQLAEFHAQKGTTKTATLNCKRGHFKVLPTLDCFPEELRQIDPLSLLTIFPEAEAKQLMLILGKSVVGSRGSRVAEGRIEHTFRSYGIIVGTDAGLGKSSLLNYITACMGKLGYSVVQAPQEMTRFGWGPIAQSDLATVDDLTTDTQKNLITNVFIKTLTSNGGIRVEEKGIAGWDTESKTTLLGCSNGYNPADFIAMDSGSISRLNLMLTYNRAELTSKYGDDNGVEIDKYWSALANRLSIDISCITAYLLRKCADYFLDVTGYSWDSGRLFKDCPDVLEDTINANRALFRIETNLSHANEVVESIINIVGLAIASEKDKKAAKMLEVLQYVDFSPSLLLTTMRLFAKTKRSNALPEEYKDLGIHQASWDSKQYVDAKLNNFDNMYTEKTSSAAFEILIRELKSKSGFGYPGRINFYAPIWDSYKRSIQTYINKYKDLETETPPEVEVAVDEISKIFNALQ
jgi:hypothetical protein